MTQFTNRYKLAVFVGLVILGSGMGQPADREKGEANLTGKLKKGFSKEEVTRLLGSPARVARQILYQRHLEQWIYGKPHLVRLEFDCPRGKESHLTMIGPMPGGAK